MSIPKQSFIYIFFHKLFDRVFRYHIAVIWDGTNNIAYVDGVEIKRGTPDRLPHTVVDSR